VTTLSITQEHHGISEAAMSLPPIKKPFGFLTQLIDSSCANRVPGLLDGITIDDVDLIEQRLESYPNVIPSKIWGTTPTGIPVSGLIGFVMLTSRQVLENRAMGLAKIRNGVHMLEESGCNPIGLGSLTGAANTGGGRSIVNGSKSFLTNGNTVAALGAVLTLEKLQKRLDFDLSKMTVGILGATGSIGNALTMSLSRHVKDLILVARMEGRLKKLSSETHCPSSWSIDVKSLSKADIIVVTTASSDCLVPVDLPKAGSIIVDETKPRNISADIRNRKDVLAVDGAYFSWPDLHMDINLYCPEGMIYGCFVESALWWLMGFEGQENFVGNVDHKNFPMMREKLALYGFDVVEPHSFDEPISDARFETFRKCMKN
jgi:fatty aldehyde-generating acyl-ACP reductase